MFYRPITTTTTRHHIDAFKTDRIFQPRISEGGSGILTHKKKIWLKIDAPYIVGGSILLNRPFVSSTFHFPKLCYSHSSQSKTGEDIVRSWTDFCAACMGAYMHLYIRKIRNTSCHFPINHGSGWVVRGVHFIYAAIYKIAKLSSRNLMHSNLASFAKRKDITTLRCPLHLSRMAASDVRIFNHPAAVALVVVVVVVVAVVTNIPGTQDAQQNPCKYDCCSVCARHYPKLNARECRSPMNRNAQKKNKKKQKEPSPFEKITSNHAVNATQSHQLPASLPHRVRPEATTVVLHAAAVCPFVMVLQPHRAIKHTSAAAAASWATTRFVRSFWFLPSISILLRGQWVFITRIDKRLLQRSVTIDN